MFIVIEGIDGSGKTTAIKYLKTLLEEKGFVVQTTKTPGGEDEVGRRIRETLLNPDLSVKRKAQPLLFLADMLQLEDVLIRPALARGEMVVCDRFKMSTEVYQVSTNDNLKPEEKTLLRLLMDRFVMTPDLTFVLLPSLEIARKRVEYTEFGTPDAFEKSPMRRWMNRYQAYKRMATQKDRFGTVIQIDNAFLTPEETAQMMVGSIIFHNSPSMRGAANE